MQSRDTSKYELLEVADGGTQPTIYNSLKKKESITGSNIFSLQEIVKGIA